MRSNYIVTTLTTRKKKQPLQRVRLSTTLSFDCLAYCCRQTKEYLYYKWSWLHMRAEAENLGGGGTTNWVRKWFQENGIWPDILVVKQPIRVRACLYSFLVNVISQTSNSYYGYSLLTESVRPSSRFPRRKSRITWNTSYWSCAAMTRTTKMSRFLTCATLSVKIFV